MEKVTEIDNGSLVKMAYEDVVEGKRPRGRPHKNGQTSFSKIQQL